MIVRDEQGRDVGQHKAVRVVENFAEGTLTLYDAQGNARIVRGSYDVYLTK